MGEIADDMRNGIICQGCGVWMPDCFIYEHGEAVGICHNTFDNPPGHPRYCPDCLEDLKHES